MQDSLPAGWLAFAGREFNLWTAVKGFRALHLFPLSWIYPDATGALAPVRVMLPQAIDALTSPSSRLAGTAILHRQAISMCCLCRAGAPSSALSSVGPSQHVILCVPGEPPAAYSQFLRFAHLPSGEFFGRAMSELTVSPLLRLAEFFDSLQETLRPGLSTAWSPSPLQDMTAVATGQFTPAGLTSSGIDATSVAAQLPPLI
jgi:hypothetical protein